nr:glycoside hydrolase family 3 C-terminal domain-containing protein [Salinisphaera sp. Q1T1-3]
MSIKQFSSRSAVLAMCVAAAPAVFAEPPKTGNEVEARVGAMVDNMNTAERIGYIRVDDGHMLPPLAKFDLPGTVAYDSSMGVHVNNKTFGAQYPSQSGLAATWNLNRAKEFGLAIGYETRAAGGQQILSPGMNLYRMPFGGREAEFVTGEDPFLGAVMGPAVVNGIQAQGIQTSAKHFLMNEQEANRHGLDVRVDERTMRELYMPGFESLVKNANVTSIMCGFNKVNGQYVCDNHHLLTDVLKGEWGFKGFVMSDFNSINDPFEGAWAGTDLDMPSGLKFTEANLMPFIWAGALSPIVIEDKVRRNLRALVSYGFDKGLPVATGLTEPEHGARASLDMAREAMVLLKNGQDDSQPVLPLSKRARIAVVGNIANGVPPSPFGTANSPPDTYVNELTGLRKLNRSASRVDYLSALAPDPATAVWYQPKTDADAGDVTGVKAEYWDNSYMIGQPTVTRVEPAINWNFTAGRNVGAQGSTDASGLDTSAWHFAARFTARIKPTISGPHVFKMRGDGGYTLWIDGKEVFHDDGDPVAADLTYSPAHSAKTVYLQKGHSYDVRFEYRRYRNDFIPALGGMQGIQLSWASLGAPKNLDKYDAVVVAAGLGSEYEGEAFDHPAELPEYQSDLIQNLSRANPNTVVLIHAGGGVKMMPWAENAGAIIQAWYPGQLGGQALAEIIYGDVNPSGKLPISIARQLKDNPAYPSYHDIYAYRGPNAKTEMDYTEGLFLGYRGYDKSGVAPLYPFGYGLSYTSFGYSDLALSRKRFRAGQTIAAQVTITNTGNRAGYETAELYVHPDQSAAARPEKELKGFTKVYLQPGESKRVTMPLNGRSLAYYVDRTDSWDIDKGRYEVRVGGASNDLPVSATLTVPRAVRLTTRDSNPLPLPLQKAVQVSAESAY